MEGNNEEKKVEEFGMDFANDEPQENTTSTTNKEELKNETVNTVKQVKETMKNVNVKEEAKATTGFVSEMFKNPIGKIKEIANDSSNKYLKTAIILIVVWVVAVLLASISFKYFSWKTFGKTLLTYLKTMLAPIVGIIVISVITFIMNKKSKKSLPTVITAVTTAKVPLIVASVINLLTLISYSASTITSRITSFASAISIVFMYFAIKYICDEEEEKNAFKIFAIIEAIYFVVAFVISYLGISI